MADVADAAKEFRVVSWLDGLLARQRRLRYVLDRLEEIGISADGMGCHKVRRDGVRVTYSPDRIGSLLARQEEARTKLQAEAEAIREEVESARRVLLTAWDANAGKADPAFAYLLARCCDDLGEADAARSVGTTTWGARNYPRQVAAMVYDSDPARFPPTAEERTAEHPFGYWAFKGR